MFYQPYNITGELGYLRGLRFVKSDFVDFLRIFQLQRDFIRPGLQWAEGLFSTLIKIGKVRDLDPGLLADLATLCANQIQPADDMPAFTMTTTPTPLQRRAFELLDLSHRHGLA